MLYFHYRRRFVVLCVIRLVWEVVVIQYYNYKYLLSQI